MTAKFEDLPDYLKREELERLCHDVLDESHQAGLERTLAAFDELADRQWHTYVEPSSGLKARLDHWLVENWHGESQEFLERVLVICYCFALRKSLFEKALSAYSGEHAQEFQQDLAHSGGEFIDPWWSLRGLAQKGDAADADKRRG